jgi:aryl sulfotransferase
MPSGGAIVWLASYPKSGNTWLRLLLANLLRPSDAPADINRIDLNSFSLVSRRKIEEVALIETGLLTLAEVDRLRPRFIEAVAAQATAPLYAKTHDAYRLTAAGEPLLGRGTASAALYVVRDPRDVAVSLAHHSGITVSEAIRELNSDDSCMGMDRRRLTRQVPQSILCWSRHVESWTAQRDVPVHLFRYEDLLADPVGTFGGAVAFLGLTASEEAVIRAVRLADFTELQQQERRAGFVERQQKSTAPFFRSGRAGAWVEVLSPAQSAAIAAAHRPMMERFGYL